MKQVFLALSESWDALPAGATPPWPSDVCDDHSPYEVSVALDERGPQLRVLVEPMDAPPSLSANLAASMRLHKKLEQNLVQNLVVDLRRLRALEDLLLPPEIKGRFAAWYAAAFDRERAPSLKGYFNLGVQGPARAPQIAEEALHRLGFHKAWPTMARILGRREVGAEELVYFALDLAPGEGARAKLYFRHHSPTAAFLDEVASVARYHQPGFVAEFCRKLSGGGEGPYTSKGPVTCFSFTDPSDARPTAATAYFPLSHHARDDAEARERITHYLQAQGLDTTPYLRTLEALARRPLEAGTGMHTYAAVRWQGKPRVTVYFSPEIYGTQPRLETHVAEGTRPATAIVDYFEEHSVADHPFFARMRREPVRLEVLARILANFRVGITREFPRRLAWLTARAPDDAIRCVLAKQLNDEMGDGDFKRAHRGMFERMFGVLTPWAPQETDEVLAPGRALGEVLERCYVTAEPYEGVGASLVVEVYGKQVDSYIADQFRRQDQIPPSKLDWLHLHENLEVEHASESLDVARLIPPGPATEAAWRGAKAVATASRTFFDTLYRQCYL
ncbi:MAG: iron-containing redox enzyme family protein [Myxococcaceae bacterium]|nr:iron-containing redox enzyme family protein [Myxococcaceae bacterium]